MAKFKKKPIIIEAEQYTEGSLINGVCRTKHYNWEEPHVHTLEGLYTVRENDWIITGVKGEIYPCKPDIFEMTYERVE